ncbi:MUSK [Cordylochernes scorpioides]|uniref:receptor protein-tyrosine kinase n=1 Tax=Cordylochernes scorpioides TaxID=51811 RepID=A0ABY6KZW1_9ARAC|nr:MUSK [Cordylochernes scorpioides]
MHTSLANRMPGAGPPRVKGGRSIYNVTWGSRVRLECTAEGDPVPEITWWRDDRKVGQSVVPARVLSGHRWLQHAYTAWCGSWIGRSWVTGSRCWNSTPRRACLLSAARPACYSTSRARPPRTTTSTSRPPSKRINGGRKKPGWCVSPEEGEEEDKQPSPSPPIEGYCAPYTGQVCKSYLQGAMVYYNMTPEVPEVPINEQITQSLWSELIKPLREPCRTAAGALLCLYAFPLCEWVGGVAVPKPLCHEDCIATQEAFCHIEWAMIEDNKQRGLYFQSRGHFRLPDCHTLPRKQSSKTVCSSAHLTDFKMDEVTTECLVGKGRFYQGNKNVTKQGIPCQYWDSQEPHSHNRPPKVFPEVLNSENYCRNAGGEEPMPWCYTMDPTVRWQHCDIPRCENASQLLEDNPDLVDLFDPPAEPIFSPSFILIICAFSLAGIVVVLGMLVVGRRLHHRHYTPTPRHPTDLVDLDKLPSNMAYHRTAAPLNPRLEALEYSRNNIIYIRDIGQGAFGRVFQAKAPGLLASSEFTMVAVKMLKDEASEDLQTDFEREACLMAEFDHPNIVKLLGVCAVGKPMCLLFEYMGKGDLNEYLRSCSPSNYIVRSNGNVFSDVRLTHLDLANIARQIAAGMVYLSERKFVHRDLATRNCLVNDQMVVKISDFGLSQKIYHANYYKGGEHDAIPIRWMPLESILYS